MSILERSCFVWSLLAVHSMFEISLVLSFYLSLDILSIHRVMIKEIVPNSLGNRITDIWKQEDENQRQSTKVYTILFYLFDVV